MSVTRIEGIRPPEAGHANTTLQSGASGTGKKSSAPDDKSSAQESATAPPAHEPYAVTFGFDKDLNRVVVRVVDRATGKVYWGIPPESVIQALKQQRRKLGRLVDEEV